MGVADDVYTRNVSCILYWLLRFYYYHYGRLWNIHPPSSQCFGTNMVYMFYLLVECTVPE
jgi:hypothetical protein